ncbi:MAG: phage protein Gp36 family protein [Verrucomicrobiota bacterium]
MWFTPSEDTIKTRISGPELNALKSAARAQGLNTDTIITAALSRIVQMIRGYVGSKHTLGAEGTIPDELESALGALWLVEFITRIPASGKLLDEARRKAAEDAMTLLKDVASGRFAIVPPTSPAPEAAQAGGPKIQLVSSSTRIGHDLRSSGLF